MKVELLIRHTGLGGVRVLTVESFARANADIEIAVDDKASWLNVGFEDIPKLIAVLEAFAKIHPAKEQQ